MKFILDNIVLISLIIMSGSALLIPYLQQRGNKLTLMQTIQFINTKKPLLLDIRETQQFSAIHLKETRNIPLKKLPESLPELNKFKNKSIIIICKSGLQFSKAENLLKKAGFTEVYGLAGGIDAWQARGLPTFSKQKNTKDSKN